MENENKQDLVSVIIPTYKRPVAYLKRAVESVLNQSYSHLECIIVDDSPESFALRGEIAAYAGTHQDQRVIYLQNEKNLGGALARNRGIEKARGNYITFLDDDDEYKPDKIKCQLAFMYQEECDLSLSDMVILNDKGKIIDYRDHLDIPSYDNQSLLHYHLTYKLTGTPSFMFRTEALRRIGGFDDAKVGQEFYLMLKAIEKGLKIRYLPECHVIVHHEKEGGISNGANKLAGEDKVYKTIQSYSDLLTPAEQRFAGFRFWAVRAVTYKRLRQYWNIPRAVMKAFFSSPKDFFVEVTQFKKRGKEKRSI